MIADEQCIKMADDEIEISIVVKIRGIAFAKSILCKREYASKSFDRLMRGLQITELDLAPSDEKMALVPNSQKNRPLDAI
jgi:hypothetical protein